MPVIFTLIGGYLINREYTDNTLKAILPVPLSFRMLLFGKLLTMGLLSILFGLYNYTITLIVGFLSGLSGLSISLLATGLLQMLGIAGLTYIAIMPLIAFTSRKPGQYMGGVIIAFLFGYSAMFVKNVTLRSLYPILSGMTIIGFDTNTFMNTSEPGNLTLSLLSLTAVLLISVIIILFTKPPQTASEHKKNKKNDLFLRKNQKTR